MKGKDGEPQHWDGLSTLFVMLAQRDPVGLTASEKGWLKALTRSGDNASEPSGRVGEQQGAPSDSGA
jgi:hypothetical protein